MPQQAGRQLDSALTCYRGDGGDPSSNIGLCQQELGDQTAHLQTTPAGLGNSG